MKFNKIWIFGGTGSGKTTFAKKLSDKLKIPFYSTDRMIYSKNFEKKYSESIRDSKLKKISKKKKWIIEGVHRGRWILPAFKKSELILFIDTGIFRRIFRTLKREIKNEKGKKVRGIPKVLYYAFIYTFDNRRHHYHLAKEGKKEVIVLKNNREINKFLESLK